MRRLAISLAAVALLGRLGAAALAEKAEKKPLTNADVVAMVKAGLAESTIVLAIRQCATNFDTSPEALIALKNEGLSQTILDAMLTAGTEKPTATVEPTEPVAGSKANDNNGKWRVSEETSPMDGSRTVVLAVDAEQAVPNLVGLDKFPRLLIRCKAHQTEAFVHTGSLPFSSVGMAGKYSVRLRFDDEQPFTQYWDESTSYDSLFAPKPVGFARQLAASRKLAFEFTPSGSGPVATWFDLEGLDRLLGRVAEACGWSAPDVGKPSPPSLVGPIHKVYVEDPHKFGYVAPGDIKKGLQKSKCLQLVDDAAQADAILTPVQYDGDRWKWIFTDRVGRRIGDWEMEYWPSAKKVEEAIGCR